MFNIIRILAKVRTPCPKNGEATLTHVSILRLIESHTFALSLIRVRKSQWMTMPIIPIKLYDQLACRHKCVYAKLIVQNVLWNIVCANIIKQSISNALNTCRRYLLLYAIYTQQVCSSFRVFVSTFYRTILDVITQATRGRPGKVFATNLAHVMYAVTTLPLDLVFQTAEIVSCRFNSDSRQIKLFAAPRATHHLTIASVLASRLIAMLSTAIHGLTIHSCTADRTRMIASASTYYTAFNRAICPISFS